MSLFVAHLPLSLRWPIAPTTVINLMQWIVPRGGLQVRFITTCHVDENAKDLQKIRFSFNMLDSICCSSHGF